MSVCPMAYETQFFGFTPQTCMLRIYLAFQDYLFEVMVVVESVILKKLNALPHCRVSPVEIRKSTERFLHFMKERFDQLFGKMEEVLLQLVLSIPRHVLLPEDRAQALYPCSREQFCALQEEISVLQRRCRAEAGAGQALRAELQEQGKVRAELESILRWFDGLENVCRERGAGSFQESFAFLRQNSRKLQEVLRDVEEKSNKMKRCDPSL